MERIVLFAKVESNWSVRVMGMRIINPNSIAAATTHATRLHNHASLEATLRHPIQNYHHRNP